MAESPQPAGAAQRVDDRSPERPGSAVLLPRRRPGHLGPIHIAQLLLVEGVLVTAALVLTQDLLIAAIAALGGLILLLVALVRHKGRWWLERRLMTWQYRRRRRAGATGIGADPRLHALRRLAPGLYVENVPTSAGGQVGVARDGAGWYAVAALTASAPTRSMPGGVPLEALFSALVDAEQPGAVLQVVTQTVPAPGIDSPPGSPANQSYRQLVAGFGSASIPADRSTWIAVRLDAWTLAETLADRSTVPQLAPALVATLIRTVGKSLRRAGISHRVLDADELLTALTNSCDLEPASQRDSAQEPREEWSAWHSPRLAHRSFWIREWPPVEQAATVLDWVSTAPAASTTVALTMTPDTVGDMIDLRGLVRVAAPASQLPEICQSIIRNAQQARTELFQLDGEQGPAVYASAPTGGGAR